MLLIVDLFKNRIMMFQCVDDVPHLIIPEELSSRNIRRNDKPREDSNWQNISLKIGDDKK